MTTSHHYASPLRLNTLFFQNGLPENSHWIEFDGSVPACMSLLIPALKDRHTPTLWLLTNSAQMTDTIGRCETAGLTPASQLYITLTADSDIVESLVEAQKLGLTTVVYLCNANAPLTMAARHRIHAALQTLQLTLITVMSAVESCLPTFADTRFVVCESRGNRLQTQKVIQTRAAKSVTHQSTVFWRLNPPPCAARNEKNPGFAPLSALTLFSQKTSLSG